MSEHELKHALQLLEEAFTAHSWGGPVSILPIDPSCLWQEDGKHACRRHLDKVVILQWKSKEGCHALALCEHHAACMEEAVAVWRAKN